MSVSTSVKPNSSWRRDKIRNTLNNLDSKHSLGLDSTASGLNTEKQAFYKMLYKTLQFVHQRDRGAADKVVSEFNRHATQVRSGWVYKPGGEADVLLSRGTSVSARKEALAIELSPEKQEALRSSLLSKLEGAKAQCEYLIQQLRCLYGS